jgi:hypothetical protein
MSTLMVTLLVAFIATVLAIASLAIGWLISGRSRIVRGSCGMDPHRRRDKHCGNEAHCSLCDTEKSQDPAKDIEQDPAP